MRRVLTGLSGLVLLTSAIAWASVQPSHGREWIPEQRALPNAVFDGDRVTLSGVRDFRWEAGAATEQAWQTRSYDLADVASVWYILTPFSTDWRGPAHAFLSFGFGDGRYLAISVEARREVGEEYSIVKGMLKRFELMYVIGDEQDLVHLRASRGDEVYAYPVRATPAQARALLTGMLTRANELHDQPRFYGSLFNNCTTNILRHVNAVAARKIRYGRRVLLPGYSDQLALERGLIDTDLGIDEARQRFRVDGSIPTGDDYSRRIRGIEPTALER